MGNGYNGLPCPDGKMAIPNKGYQPVSNGKGLGIPPQGGSGVPHKIESHRNSNSSEIKEDNWSNKTSDMVCRTCMFYVNFRCRKNAPTIKGFPAVFPTDWCGEHKLDKAFMKEQSGE